MTPVLQVFARAPEPGACKTRLIPALGADGAADLQRRLTQSTLRMAAHWREGTPCAQVELWCAPDDSHAFFADCARKFGVPLRIQPQGDLGARMWLALAGALGQERLPVLVGTDCPWLAAPDISGLHRALAGHAGAFIPAEDGGYVAVGIARAVPELFAGVAWGSDRVMAETRERARRWKVDLCEIGRLPDVDVPQDLERLRRDPLLAGLLSDPRHAAGDSRGMR